MSNFFKFVVPKVPSLISTSIKHCINGPPQSSWDLKFNLTIEFMKLSTSDISKRTIEEAQEQLFSSIPAPDGMIINELKVDNKYRYEAQVHIEKILKPYQHVLEDDWKDLKDDGIAAEWVQVPDDGWEKREIRKTILYLHGGAYYLGTKSSITRKMTSTIAKKADARVFAIDYRLAPQNQFPAGLQDALAAYLYLLNPPKDAGFEPINPKHIVIAGSSAGGGLSMALALALRDAGLQSCAGIVGLSSWVDLTFSMPSVLKDECSDYLPSMGTAFYHKSSPVYTEFKEKATALSAKIKEQNLGPKIWHDSVDLPERIHFYAPNEALTVPYVSPMLADSLGDLPPILLIVGGEERFCDENIYLAFRCSEPSKYKGPSYNPGKFEKSPFKTPTNITLEVYEEMPHVFQMFEHNNSKVSYEHATNFINRVIDTPIESLPPSSYSCINGKGESGLLKENYKDALKWDKIGITPPR